MGLQHEDLSLMEWIALGTDSERREILAQLTDKQMVSLQWDWLAWGRPKQFAPRDAAWLIWLILAGRGFGKTRTGSETIRQWMCGETPTERGKYRHIALVAETAADARDVLVEGPSGLLATHPKSFRPRYEPSKRRLTWPNGATATTYNAREPDQLRGPQHDAAWCDELAKWMYVRETWDMLQFSLRSGVMPRQIITTTPRPIGVLREIMAMPECRVTRGSTYENLGNLAPPFLQKIISKYEGTRLGRQELLAEILDDIPGALWTRDTIDRCKIRETQLPTLRRIVVGVDPSGTRGDPDTKSNDVGIIAVGIDDRKHAYVLADYTLNASPALWGKRVVEAYVELKADRVLGEINYGGAMVEHVIQTAAKDAQMVSVPYREVKASRGKIVRAEPCSALYEQKRVSHVGSFPDLEDQLCAMTPDGYVGDGSPDRADALVWCLTDLLLNAKSYDASLAWVA